MNHQEVVFDSVRGPGSDELVTKSSRRFYTPVLFRNARGGTVGCMLRRALIVALPLVFCASADAAPVRARLPEVVRGGAWVTVRGRAPVRASVVLERRSAGAWRALSARSRASGGRRYSLRWRAPRRRGVVVLRVIARRSGRVVGVSAARRVGVTLTAVLGASRITSAPAPGGAGTLRFRGRGGGLRAGEFVAAGAGGATPGGLLARVVAVRHEGADTVVRVVPAGLLEAVPEGRLRLGATLSGAAAEQPARGRSFRLPLICRADAGGRVSGALSVALDPALVLSWSGGAVRSVRASAALHGRGQLSAAVDGPAGCTLAETPVGTWLWPPLTGFVGPVPVVVVPQTTLYVAGEAQTGGPASASVEGRMSATAGLRWEAGDVRPIGSFSHTF